MNLNLRANRDLGMSMQKLGTDSEAAVICHNLPVDYRVRYGAPSQVPNGHVDATNELATVEGNVSEVGAFQVNVQRPSG